MYFLTRPKCWKILSRYSLCHASTLAFCLWQSDAVTQKVHMYFLSDASSDTSTLDFCLKTFFLGAFRLLYLQTSSHMSEEGRRYVRSTRNFLGL